VPDATFGGGFHGTGSSKMNVFFGNDIISGSEFGNAVAIQSDGKIIVAGYTNLNGGGPSAANDFAIARLNTDGSLDSTFDGDGKVTLDLSPVGLTADDRANAVLVQPDGKIVLAGSSELLGIARFAFARFNTNGSLDPSFGVGGMKLMQVGDNSAGDYATSLALQPDGKIVAAGYTDANGTGANPNNFAIVRLLDNGSLDPDFNGTGKQTVDFGNDDRAAAMTIQTDGRLVVAGSRDAGGGASDFAVARLTFTGKLDNSFDGDGQQTINIGGNSGLILATSDYATGVKVQQDDKIVVGGFSTLNVVGGIPNFAAARLTKVGGFDTTFGTDGVQTVDFGSDDRANGIALQTDGRIVLAGGNSKDIALARLTGEVADLSVTVTNDVPQVIARNRVSYAIRVQNNGSDTVSYTDFAPLFPVALTDVSYFSLFEGNASANPASGTGLLVSDLVLPPGGAVRFIVLGTVSPTATGTLTVAASVPPQGWFDPNSANSAASDTDPIVTPSPGNFSLSAATYTVAENGGTATITVNRVGGSDGEVSVRYRARDLTALAGADYSATNGTLTWANGDSAPKTFTIPITDDALVEGAETVEVYLDGPSPGTALGTPYNAVLSITDNDTAAGMIHFTLESITLVEGTRQATIVVVRDGFAVGEVTVRYSTADGTARAGEDYAAASGTLRWADGDSSLKTILISYTDDGINEGPETFTLTLSDPTGGATLGPYSTITFTLRDPNTIPPPLPTPVPQPALVGGAMNGSAIVLTPSPAPYAAGSPVTLIPGGTNVRVATADVNGDGFPDRIVGAGPGGSPTVLIVDGKTGTTLASFPAFEASFGGGVYVAAGDVDGDGKAEVVVTPDEGGGPVVAMYSGAKVTAGLTGDAAQIVRFFGIADPAFRGGARPALGDVNGDGAADLAVAAGFLGGPRIALFNGKQLVTRAAEYAGTGNPDGSFRLVGDFFAYESGLRNGSFVAIGDVTGDGKGDLAFGAGPDGAPRVRVFDGAKLLAAGAFVGLDDVPTAQVANFFAGDSSLRGSVRVALRDADGNGKADLLTGSGQREASRVRVYKSATLLAGATAADQEIDPFASAVLGNGVFVG
jgi:uncharacterized delta-60 repeat protein